MQIRTPFSGTLLRSDSLIWVLFFFLNIGFLPPDTLVSKGPVVFTEENASKPAQNDSAGEKREGSEEPSQPDSSAEEIFQSPEEPTASDSKVEAVSEPERKAGEPALPDSIPEAVPPAPEASNPRALRYNGIYLNSSTVANQDRINELIARCKGTVISGFVIDMKDDQGSLSYKSKVPLAKEIGSGRLRLRDPEKLVRLLHENGLKACARVVCFKDKVLASYSVNGAYPYAVLDSSTGLPWEQDNGEKWANPYDERIHGYLLGLIDELLSFGFDQIQLDYARFPSDGKMKMCRYPVAIDSLNNAEVIGLFLAKVRGKLDSSDVSLAVDVFGWVPWLQKKRHYVIGQDYDIIARYADVICPMMYSSHFPKDFKEEFGLQRAYQIVREGTAKAVERKGARPTGVQPYIQGFKWRTPHFGSNYLIEQMHAAQESGALGWIVWNARNDYSALWEALELIGKFSEKETE
ncbi:MAG TPA: putative glycoside hydrolase [archaeon]|nr:putative glycoside hydrolase [archaeon]